VIGGEARRRQQVERMDDLDAIRGHGADACDVLGLERRADDERELAWSFNLRSDVASFAAMGRSYKRNASQHVGAAHGREREKPHVPAEPVNATHARSAPGLP
jgi:hypothetical protein